MVQIFCQVWAKSNRSFSTVSLQILSNRIWDAFKLLTCQFKDNGAIKPSERRKDALRPQAPKPPHKHINTHIKSALLKLKWHSSHYGVQICISIVCATCKLCRRFKTWNNCWIVGWCLTLRKLLQHQVIHLFSVPFQVFICKLIGPGSFLSPPRPRWCCDG